MPWKSLKTDEFVRRHKFYEKKRKKQLLAVLNNLETFVSTLNLGHKPKPFCYGFLHNEPADVIAIDQGGSGGGRLAETRLYLYPDTETETLYLLTIGDKKSQSDDIENCKRFVKQIKNTPKTGENQYDGNTKEED